MARAKRSASRSGRTSKDSSLSADGELGPQARLAVNLPIKAHRQLKARAAAEGNSIRDYIVELLRKNGIG